MTASRDLAAQLAVSIFDRIESDRTLIRQNIETVIIDGLLLAEAKRSQPASLGGAASQEVMDATILMVKLLMHDTTLYVGIPKALKHSIDNIYEALRRSGWRP